MLIEQINTETGRWYKTPSGAIYPSVTSVLGILSKDYIEQWREDVGHEKADLISRRAASRGTRLHNYIEKYILKKEFQFSSILDQMLFDSAKPVIDKITDVVCTETRLYSDILTSAGTVDLIASYNTVPSVIDYKSSSRPKYRDEIYSYFMQAAAYSLMFEELYGIKIPQIVIIIAVEHDEPQVFIENRKHWVLEYIKIRKLFTNNFI